MLTAEIWPIISDISETVKKYNVSLYLTGTKMSDLEWPWTAVADFVAFLQYADVCCVCVSQISCLLLQDYMYETDEF